VSIARAHLRRAATGARPAPRANAGASRLHRHRCDREAVAEL